MAARKSVSTLYAEWEKTTKQAKELADTLNRKYKPSGMKLAEVAMLATVWMTLKWARRLTDIIVRYPKAIDYTELTRSDVFDDVVREMANAHCEWPSEAVAAFKDWMNYGHHGHPAHVHQHILHRLSQEEDFTPYKYRRHIIKYGTASLCARLIDEKEVSWDDLRSMVHRFRNANTTYADKHPLVRLAQAKKIPTETVDDIVSTLIKEKQFKSACVVVKKTKRDDLIPLLEEQALQSTDLYQIRDFLKDFPKADKEKFRDIVRKLLTPDPEDFIDAFLSGKRGSRHGMMQAMYGMPMIMCGPRPWEY